MNKGIKKVYFRYKIGISTEAITLYHIPIKFIPIP